MRYESEQDLINEEEVIKIFTQNKYPYKKLGENELDFLVIDKAYVEIKCTNLDSKKYSSQLISLIKVVKMQEYSRKLPTFLVYKYSDCIMYIEVKDMSGEVKWFSRKKGIENRKTATNDSELVLWIPKKKMKTIKLVPIQ